MSYTKYKKTCAGGLDMDHLSFKTKTGSWIGLKWRKKNIQEMFNNIL